MRPGAALLLVLLLAVQSGWPAVNAQPPLSVAEISAQLRHSPVLRGQFSQTKHVAGFSNPLRSSGRFLLAREHGVIWDTEQPFPSTIVLSQAQLLSRVDGHSQVLISAADGTATAAIHGLLMALIGGDFAQLGAQFEIQPLSAESGWALRLEPTDPLLQRVFESVQLRGADFVEQVQMNEPGGDRSLIEFIQLNDQPAQLSAAEVALFD